MVAASSTRIFLLAFCLSALATAYAGPAITYTDGFGCNGRDGICTAGFEFFPYPLTTYGVGASGFQGSSFGPFPQPTDLSFGFSAPLSDFFEYTVDCFPAMCTYLGGDFSGGTMGMTADIFHFPNGPTQTLTLAGVISAGSFYSSLEQPCMGYPCAEQNFYLDFSGQWSNGWTSTGTIYMDETLSDDQPFGSLQLNTTTPTPEPASLCLFGTGVIGLAGTLHRKWALRRCGREKVDVKPA